MTDEITEEAMWADKDVNVASGVRALEDIRMDLRVACKYFGLGGIPEELQERVNALAQESESVEVAISNWAFGITA
jgi:phosphoribosylformimino-5-aminoimidazole carboxamide ribonucleotide (ProFAR) isomerase